VRLGAIVLAAGAGQRFGGPKQLARVDGRAMVARVVDAALVLSAVESVVVVVGARAGVVEAELGSTHPAGARLRVQRCEAWERGIGASLACGARVLLGTPVDAAIVLLGDQPLVDAALIEAVLAAGLPAVVAGTHDAVRPVGADGAPGHPVLLSSAALARALDLDADHGVIPVLDPARVLAVPVTSGAATFDVDTPADLVVARALAAASATGGGAADGHAAGSDAPASHAGDPVA
jgi:CTP:molybdopterin cytidylyltransferase MocA